MYFLREQSFSSLWLLISVAAALCLHGCWLVWLLIYLTVLFYQELNLKKIIFLLKFSPQVKVFAILTCISTNLGCTKDCGLLLIKQTDGLGLCFEHQIKFCKLRGRTAGSQGGLDDSRLCQKFWEGA